MTAQSGGAQFRAVTQSVTAMRGLGLLEPVDEATVELVLGLAAAVDAEPGNASLWREYRGALADLRGLNDGGGDDFRAAMAGLFASVRNAEDTIST